jgi:hypothetical protein
MTGRTPRSARGCSAAALADSGSLRVHPAVGVARAGNSESEFLVRSEMPEPIGRPSGHYRDAGDAAALRLPAIKRQAELFRIFAYDATGECLGEVTAERVQSIEWTVELANRKASGARRGLTTVPNSAGRRPPLRNGDVGGTERWRLEITPHPRRVAGVDQRAVFDDGTFMGIPVALGEIRTDPQGRLLVLGGLGQAATHDAIKRIRAASDNDGWYDDLADGPVSARVTFKDGRVMQAAPAWAVVTPPDFAPGIRPAATQYDVLLDWLVRNGSRQLPEVPSFAGDVLPILDRLSGVQWVSRRAALTFGIGADAEGLDIQANLGRLADPAEEGREARERLFGRILDHCAKPSGGDWRSAGADAWLRLTTTQLAILRSWAAGMFKADWPTKSLNGRSANATAAEPAALDREALECCAGGAVFADLDRLPVPFLPDDPFRLDRDRLAAGDLTRSLPCPWQAGLMAAGSGWPAILVPGEVLTTKTYERLQSLEAEIAALPADGGGDRRRVLQQRRHGLWETRQSWLRALPRTVPAIGEALIKEWQHLGFVVSRGPGGEPFACGGKPCFIETERSPYLGSMADYFHRLVNFEDNHDFAAKALELARQMLDDAKFSAHPRFAPFSYTPEALDERLDRIYADFVDEVMYEPVPWESGDISWEAEVDYAETGEPICKQRVFHVGRFSDRAVAERFRQFAPLNLTDGAWLQNIIAARPIDGVMARLASIWLDEAGNGRPELNHSNVYETLLRSLNIYLPPVTSRDFVDQDLVPSAFESSVFQFSIGLFPKRFLPEILGLTLFVEWEATPTMYAIARMMANRHIDPQYYRMHAAIDNINSGHGALAKEAIKLYLSEKQKEGGNAVMQEHWQRIWRGYVAWSTLGNGADEIIERMLLVDKKQIHLRCPLLRPADVLAPLAAALRSGCDPVSAHLRDHLTPATHALLADWSAGDPLGDPLRERIATDVNRALRSGIYDAARFASAGLSAATRRLIDRAPRDGAEMIDLGRALLEDAYPAGVARRPGFPDVRAYYAGRIADLVRRKTRLALQSHRRRGWLMEAFRSGPEGVMKVLVERGYIDIDHPGRSRLFAQTEFSGPMYGVFSGDERAIIIDWIESLRADGDAVTQPEPADRGDRVQPGLARRDHDTPAARPIADGGAQTAWNLASERRLSGQRWRLGMGSAH